MSVPTVQNRGQLPGVVVQEFENLISRLRSFILKGHDEDGNHEGITYSGPITHITVEKGIVIGVS